MLAYREPVNFDPWEGTAADYELCFVYEKLMTGDLTKGPGGTKIWNFTESSYLIPELIKPWLAESFERPDPLTLIFHIRKGIKWQNKPPVNGREFTADDVAYSYKRLRDSPKASKMFLKYVDSITATDKYTVVFKLNRPHVGIAEGLTTETSTGWMHNREAVETFGDLKNWRNAVGTGPFLLVDYVSGSSVTYVRNPDYWAKDQLHPENQIPYVDKVVRLIVPDVSTQISALRTGKIDILSDVSWQNGVSLDKENPELKKVKYLRGNPILGITWRTDKAPFSDLRVRRALNMAIDRQSLVKQYLNGQGELLNWQVQIRQTETYYTPIDKLPASAKELFEYSPDKAKKLLAEAGYPKGFSTELVLEQMDVDVASAVKAWWANIGVNLELKVVDAATLGAMAYGKTYTGMARVSMGSGVPYIGGTSWFESTELWNQSVIKDPVLDDMIYTALYKTSDPVERDKLCKAINVYEIDNCFYMQLPFPYLYNYWQPWLPDYHGEYWIFRCAQGLVMAHIWIDQDMKKAKVH